MRIREALEWSRRQIKFNVKPGECVFCNDEKKSALDTFRMCEQALADLDALVESLPDGLYAAVKWNRSLNGGPYIDKNMQHQIATSKTAAIIAQAAEGYKDD